MSKKVYITRKLPEVAEQKLREAGFETTVNPEDRILKKEELVAALAADSYDAVLCLLTDTIDKEVFDAVPSAKIFSNYAVGVNNINIEDAKERGITVTNTPGVLSDSVAEHTIALILSLSKRIVEADKFVRDGKYVGWGPMLMLGTDLKGKTLGLLGAGRIGSLVASAARKGLGMNVIYYDIKKNEDIEKEGAVFRESIEEVLKESDFVSIHVPLLDSTRHMINKERLSVMKKSAYLVNTSRGPIIDETALVEALRNESIRGAALDVFENEPGLADGLAQLSNVILTPHTASATESTRSKMAEMAVQAIIDFFEGREPQNKVS
jgi:lactate dehydrogenase-like 2-hydroxyacid dehydrogenase